MNNGATGLIRRIEERERRRIRRLIAPHLIDLYHQLGMIETKALRAIDAATRAPKKQKAVAAEVRCRTCDAKFDSKKGNAPCSKPSPGREYVDTGKGNHVFVEQTRAAKKARKR